jgi:hypothetical protein
MCNTEVVRLSNQMTVPAFDSAMAVLSHVYFGPLIRKLVENGVPDLLDSPAPASDVAQRAGLHPLSLERVLRALTAFGIFTEVQPGTFENNEASRLFRNRPGGLRNWVLFATSEQFLRSAAALGHSLATGQAAHEHVFGQTVWEYMRDNPDANQAFNRGLAEVRKDEHSQVAQAYDWSGVRSVVDIGGGAGSLIAAILRNGSEIAGTLLDRPEVLADADHLLSGLGVRQRCDLIGASFFEPIDTTADIWILSQILHDWADSECRIILRRCRERMRSADRLLVVEMVPVPGEPNIGVAIMDIGMMAFAGEARQRTVNEYADLFTSAGLELTRVLPTTTSFQFVEAKAV